MRPIDADRLLAIVHLQDYPQPWDCRNLTYPCDVKQNAVRGIMQIIEEQPTIECESSGTQSDEIELHGTKFDVKESLRRDIAYWKSEAEGWERCYRELAKTIRWIPCSERLPENDSDVIVTLSDGFVEQAHYDRVHGIDYWFGSRGLYDEKIHHAIAWQELPEPYREGEK